MKKLLTYCLIFGLTLAIAGVNQMVWRLTANIGDVNRDAQINLKDVVQAVKNMEVQAMSEKGGFPFGEMVSSFKIVSGIKTVIKEKPKFNMSISPELNPLYILFNAFQPPPYEFYYLTMGNFENIRSTFCKPEIPPPRC